jgi:hypothetical protein
MRPVSKLTTVPRGARLLGSLLAAAGCLAAGTLLAARPAVADPSNQTASIEAVNGDQDLNVRAAPGLAQPIVGTLPPNASVTVIGGPVTADGWVWCELTSSVARGWSVCLALIGAQHLAAGQPAPAGGTSAGAAPPAATMAPPPPPPLTPVRLPLPQGAQTPGGPSGEAGAPAPPGVSIPGTGNQTAPSRAAPGPAPPSPGAATIQSSPPPSGSGQAPPVGVPATATAAPGSGR